MTGVLKAMGDTIAVPTVAPTGGCPVGWLAYEGKCFRVPEEPNSWPECVNACYPGWLACVNDAAENDFLYDAFLPENDRYLWLAYNDVDNEGAFAWTAAAQCSSTYENWDEAGDEPNNQDGREDCTMMFIYQRGQWNDGDCLATRNSNFDVHCLCERFGRTPAPSVACPEDAIRILEPALGDVTVGDPFELSWASDACVSSFAHVELCAYVEGGGEACGAGVANADEVTSAYFFNDGAATVLVPAMPAAGAGAYRLRVSDDGARHVAAHTDYFRLLAAPPTAAPSPWPTSRPTEPPSTLPTAAPTAPRASRKKSDAPAASRANTALAASAVAVLVLGIAGVSVIAARRRLARADGGATSIEFATVAELVRCDDKAL